VVLLCSVAVPAQALTDMGRSASASAANDSRPCAVPLLDDPAGGANAVHELGSDLAAAAAEADMTPAAYRELLMTDATVRVDECGTTFVVEPEHTPGDMHSEVGGDSSSGGPAVAGALDASGNAFTLQSRPGSGSTIYLDFDGEHIVDTFWKTADNPDFLAPAFDIDGSLTNFSTGEQDIVRGVWQRVAEDYAPFDVNVTTQDPGPAAITRIDGTDAVYGTRALVTSENGALFASLCNRACGGIAYLNAFDRTSQHAATQPALIFQKGTASKCDAASAIDLAEYGGKNREDDLAVIAQHGLPVMGDDHVGSMSGATILTSAAGASDGLIATRDDVDWFSFTVPAGRASTTVRVTPQTVGANLDARLDVYDATGAPLAASYPPVSTLSCERASGLDASVSLSLAAGSYFAKVDGVGFGDSPAPGTPTSPASAATESASAPPPRS
jgi:Bacterial pre-peptidase C-terminal domain